MLAPQAVQYIYDTALHTNTVYASGLHALLRENILSPQQKCT